MKRVDLSPLVNALMSLMFLYWETEQDKEERRTNDFSHSEAISAARHCLALLGYDVPSLQEFSENIEHTLKMDPHDFVNAIGRHKP